MFICLTWVDNFLISFSLGVGPLLNTFKGTTGSFWPESENSCQESPLFYFLCILFPFVVFVWFFFFILWYESGLYHQGLSPGKWLVFWHVFSWFVSHLEYKLELNLYFSLLGERILLIVVYNFFVLSFPQLLSQIQTL